MATFQKSNFHLQKYLSKFDFFYSGWLCLMIVLLYLILGTVTMSHVHDVSLVDGLLYTFSLLVTIGMTLDSDISIISVLTTSIYIILGVAIMSMCAYCLSKVLLKFTFIHKTFIFQNKIHCFRN